jgi:hypothetical protein
MVDIVLLAASCTLDVLPPVAEKAYEMDNKPNIFRGNETQWAGSREIISLFPVEAELFS